MQEGEKTKQEEAAFQEDQTHWRSLEGEPGAPTLSMDSCKLPLPLSVGPLQTLWRLPSSGANRRLQRFRFYQRRDTSGRAGMLGS